MNKLPRNLFCLLVSLLTAAHVLAEVPATDLPRQVVLEGARNFRDLGGYPAGNGYRVAYGRIFRSDNLSRLSVGDWQTLHKLGVRSVVDFRSAEEVQAAPSHPPPDIAVKALPIGLPGLNIEDFRRRVLSGELDQELTIQSYGDIALNHPESYRQWFAFLLQGPGTSVFHCTSGKDRTGLAAMLLLSALGVPRDVVIDDFDASNRFLERGIEASLQEIRKNPAFKGDERMIRRLLGVERRQMELTIAEIEARHGALDHYLEAVLGVGQQERQKLRSLYLQAVASD